jgi:hypothetical protein
MKPNPIHRLPAPLEAAVQRLKLTARNAAERTIESLGLAALAAGNVFARDALLGAQFELNRKSAVFTLAFNDAFDERVTREVGPRGAPGERSLNGMAAWDTLTLVDDHDVEVQISAERFGLEISHACEWELRELNAFVATLLGLAGAPGSTAGADADRNPLRPEIVGHAMIRGIEAVSDRKDTRKVLSEDLSRSLGGMLRATYAEIVVDLRGSGVRPMGMSVRSQAARGTDYAPLGRGGHGRSHDSRSGEPPSDSSSGSGLDSRHGGRGGGLPTSSRRGTPLGQVDAGLMTLMRRLAFNNGGDASAVLSDFAAASAGSSHSGLGTGPGDSLPNLIHAHRDELRQAAAGSLDHMVIDVIGSLFDQILADPKVPPQMARQIARLQLPVLRAALGDPSFFSSRRHPVRRFVNRIASLGAAVDDFSDERGQRFLAKVRELVQDVVEGDFDQIELYERKLFALEAFTREQAREDVQAEGNAAELLDAKEDEQRLRQLYARRLEGELKGLAAPDFVRDFISRIWSQVMLRAAQNGGVDGEQAKRLRACGRNLFMSVQPKPTPAHRKAFLAELPKMMLELTEGMDLIGWPESKRRDFFGQLMPAHAEALKAAGLRTLDINLMAKQVDGALDRPAPSRDELRAAPAQMPVLTDTVGDEIAVPQFSAEEAARVGLVEESAIDWNGEIDIDLSAEPEPVQALSTIPGLPAEVEEAPEPTRGKGLADAVQIGFAYQMHIEGEWQKVKLSHVSAARSFFVFTRGKKHKQSVSLTQRMLVRMCETGRMRAFENAYLIERATARARRQLASMGSSSGNTTH